MPTLSILLTRGTKNAMITLYTIVSGAASFDFEKISIFVMDHAAMAFRKDVAELHVDPKDPKFEVMLTKGVEMDKIKDWKQEIAIMKDFVEVTITICSLMTDIDGLTKDDFIDIVDRIGTIGSYMDDLYEYDKFITI